MPPTSPPPCRASSSPVAAGKPAAAAPVSRLCLLRLSRRPVLHAASSSTRAGVRKSARTATAIRQTGARDENPYVQSTAGRLHLARGAGVAGDPRVRPARPRRPANAGPDRHIRVVPARASAHPGAGHGRPHRDQSRRSEEHTSELQSLAYLVCRLLLEKKKKGLRPDCGSYSTEL